MVITSTCFFEAGIIIQQSDVPFSISVMKSNADNYRKYNWCRYCGATVVSAFEGSPWGPNKLCAPHNKKWKRNQLTLPSEEPLYPIDATKSSTPKYLKHCARVNKTPNSPLSLSAF